MGGKISKQKIHLKTSSKKTNSNSNYNDYYSETSTSTSMRTAAHLSLTSTTNFDTYLFMDGRRFYNTSTYILPSDSIEIRRSDFVHELYKYRWRGNFVSPVKEKLQSPEGGRVLDCGCGAGKWSYEMAVKYPNSIFVGLDLAPTFSINDDESKPLNLAFLEYNACNGLPFQDETFDFIFQRSMIIALNKSQWNIMVNEFARTIKPGGWLELMELQINGLNLTKIARQFQKALDKYQELNDHYPYHNVPFHDLLKSTNRFASIKVIQKRIAIGCWGGEFGLKVADVMVETFKAIKPTLKQTMNITETEYDELLHKLSKEIKNPINNYMYVTSVKTIAKKN